MTVVIAIPVPELDDFEGFRIDLGLESQAIPVGSPDFVTAVIDLDPGNGPALTGGHCFDRFPRLPSIHRDMAIVVVSLGDTGTGKRQNEDRGQQMFHRFIVPDQRAFGGNHGTLA